MRLSHILGAFLLPVGLALADSEIPNSPIVASGDDGSCYAKSVPASIDGSKGFTRVYRVKAGEDELVTEYPWYALRLRLACVDSNPVLIRIGPWPRGVGPSDEDLGIAFYRGGRMIRSHSTLDIAGNPPKFTSSASHYNVLSYEFRFETDPSGWAYYFVAGLAQGGEVAFDAFSGHMVRSSSVNGT